MSIYEAPPPALPELRFATRPPPFWSRGVVLALVALLEVWLWFEREPLVALASGGDPQAALDALRSLGTGLALVLLYRSLRRRGGSEPLVVGERLVLPPRDGEGPLRLRYSAVRLLGVGPNGAMLLRTSRGGYVLEEARFAEEGGAEAAVGAIRSQIARLPDGNQRLAVFDGWQRSIPGRIHVPVVTYVLMGMGALVFPLQIFFDPALNEAGWNAAELLLSGEYDRLISATFMHGGAIHLCMNGFALLALGGLVEHLFGARRFIALFFLSALGGSLASAALGPSLPSLGASTALFGLLGALGAVQWRFRGTLPKELFPAPRQWLWLLVLNGMISLLPMVDGAAHVGGFATGVVAALALSGPRPPLDESKEGAALEWALAAIAVLLTVAALVTTGLRAFG